MAPRAARRSSGREPGLGCQEERRGVEGEGGVLHWGRTQLNAVLVEDATKPRRWEKGQAAAKLRERETQKVRAQRNVYRGGKAASVHAGRLEGRGRENYRGRGEGSRSAAGGLQGNLYHGHHGWKKGLLKGDSYSKKTGREDKNLTKSFNVKRGEDAKERGEREGNEDRLQTEVDPDARAVQRLKTVDR